MERRKISFIYLAFCHSVYEDICNRRPRKQCDLCCLEPPSTPTTPAESIGIPLRLTRLFSVTRSDRKKAQLRFRWFLAYTLIHNRTLLDSKKHVNADKLYHCLLRGNSSIADEIFVSDQNLQDCQELQSSDLPTVESKNESQTFKKKEKQIKMASSESTFSPLIEHN